MSRPYTAGEFQRWLDRTHPEVMREWAAWLSVPDHHIEARAAFVEYPDEGGHSCCQCGKRGPKADLGLYTWPRPDWTTIGLGFSTAWTIDHLCGACSPEIHALTRPYDGIKRGGE